MIKINMNLNHISDVAYTRKQGDRHRFKTGGGGFKV